MPQSRSKYQFYQESMMAQRVADKYPAFVGYVGADPQTSLKIMFFETLGKHNKIDLTKGDMPLFMDLLHGRRQVLFATSERTNEITKLGFMLPKSTKEVDYNDETG